MPIFYDKKIRIFKTSCGPYDNNAYLIVSPDTNEGIIIDAPMEPEVLLQEALNIDVKYILITHRHQDHLAGLSTIREKTGALIGVHGEDAEALPMEADFLLKDQDNIVVANINMTVLHTPGHTPGSVCYLVEDNIFSGDTLFPGGPGHSSSAGKLSQTIKSITEKLFVLPDSLSLLPGHGKEGVLGVSKEEYKLFASRPHPEDLSGDVLWLQS
ncbi:MAG: MBL fold metallo-hydrolase [Dehalococcoidia bacterium]|nr:MBL fold metallo-hydrolase [Dehalococcoidia bacterium]